MAHEETNLFNIDFNSISDDTIEMSEVLADTSSVATEEPEIVEEEFPTTPPVSEEEEEPSKEPKKKKETPPVISEEIDITEEVEDETKEPGSEAESSSPVTPFATLLHERGFLPNFDADAFGEAVTASDDPFGVLAQAMKNELDYASSNFINSFPPQLIDMAKAVSAGVPFEALSGHKMQEINYSKIEEDTIKESEDLQKKLVSDFYASKGFSEKRTNRLIETLGDSGGLEEEAMDAKEELTVLAKEKQDEIKKQFAHQQKQMTDEHAAQINHIGQSIDAIEEVIPGVNITKNVKDRLFNNMTQIVGKDQNGQPMNYVMAMRQQNPVQFDMAVTYLADMTKGFTDWSKISKSAKSTATAQLEKTLSKQNTGHTYGTPKKTPRSEQAEGDMMASLTKMFGKTPTT